MPCDRDRRRRRRGDGRRRLLRRAPVRLTRRATLAGLAAALAAPAAARALEGPLPRPRGGAGPRRPRRWRRSSSARGSARCRALAVADAATGEMIEAHRADLDRPPASVAKIVTALYALDRLGPAHRFATRLVATGPVEGGALGAIWCWPAAATRCSTPTRSAIWRGGARRRPRARSRGGSWSPTGALPGLPEIDAGPAGGGGLQPGDLGDEPELQPGVPRLGAGRRTGRSCG